MRITWLLGELNIPYDVKEYNFYNMERLDPEFLKLNPGASFPVVEDDGVVLTESGAIINHILQKYGQGRFQYPEGTPERAMVDQWMYWSEGNYAIHQRYVWDHLAKPPGCIIDPIPSVGEYGKEQAIKYSLQLELALRDTGYVVGDDLTGADFMLSFPIFMGKKQGFFENRPKILAYLDRLLERPAFQQASKPTDEFRKTMYTDPEYISFRVPEATVEMWR